MKNCPKCHKEMKLVRVDNKFGTFIKIMECGCKELTPVLPDGSDEEIWNG
jgi:hypothetical protein